MGNFLENSGQNVLALSTLVWLCGLCQDSTTSCDIFVSPHSLQCILLRFLLSSVTGLCAISLSRQMAMLNAIKHIQEIIQNTITLFKTEKILTNVNWTLVEEKTKIKYSIPVSPSFLPWVCLSCFRLL